VNLGDTSALVRPLNVDPNYVPPLALAIIAGLLIFALAGRSHGPSGIKTTLHCPDYVATTPHRGRVRIAKIKGAGTSCAQVRRVLVVWVGGDFRATGDVGGGFTCGFDTPSAGGPTGGCRRTKQVGVRFDVRFDQ
jgi:hypothetical protein